MNKFFKFALVALGITTLFCSTVQADEIAKAVDTADTATKLLTSIVDGMKQLATTYGAPATDLALETVRMKSVGRLLDVVPASFLLLFNFWLVRWFHRGVMKSNWDSEAWIPVGLWAIFTSGFGILVVVGGLFSAKVWYGLFYPQVVLASDVIAKVLN